MTEAAYLHSTRSAYDTVAADYAELLDEELDHKPFDRAMLAAFAELVAKDQAEEQADGSSAGGSSAGGGPRLVADIGCGPGRITRHLRALGLNVFGLDLSYEMVAVGRGAHPEIPFVQGSMTDLGLRDEVLSGAVAWYATVHTPPELLPRVFAELHRVLVPGGHLLLAYKVGDERRHLSAGYGHAMDLDVYWTPAELIAKVVSEAGLLPVARLIREPDELERPRSGQQGYVLAQKPART
jgi:SAM-dependent methyltransferase